MECINLEKQFGDRFKVTYEETYFAQYGPKVRTEDPHFMVLLCQHGHVYPHGGETLAVSTNRRGSVATRLAELDCITVLQDGSDGVNVTFHIDDFDQVGTIMKPRKARPRLSDEHKAKLSEAGHKHRFSTGSRSSENERESPPGDRLV